MIWPPMLFNTFNYSFQEKKTQTPSTSLCHSHTAAADSLFQLPLGCFLNSTCVRLNLPYLSYFFTIPIFYVSSLISLPEIQAQIFSVSLHSPKFTHIQWSSCSLILLEFLLCPTPPFNFLILSLFCLEFYFTFYPFYCILSLNDASPGHPILPAHSCLLVHCCKPLLFSYLYPLQWVLTAYPTNPKALPWLSSPSTDQVVPKFYAPRSSLPSPYTVKNYTYHS